jgi:hypothetical protein
MVTSRFEVGVENLKGFARVVVGCINAKLDVTCGWGGKADVFATVVLAEGRGVYDSCAPAAHSKAVARNSAARNA